MENLLNTINCYLKKINAMIISDDLEELEEEMQFLKSSLPNSIEPKDFTSLNNRTIFLVLLCLHKDETNGFRKLEEFSNFLEEKSFFNFSFKQQIQLKIISSLPKCVLSFWQKSKYYLTKIKFFKKTNKKSFDIFSFLSNYEPCEREVFRDFLIYQKGCHIVNFIETVEKNLDSWKKSHFLTNSKFVAFGNWMWKKKKEALILNMQDFHTLIYKINTYYLRIESESKAQKQMIKTHKKYQQLLSNLQVECLRLKNNEYFYLKSCYIYKLPIEIVEPLFEIILRYNTKIYEALKWRNKPSSYYLNLLLEKYRIPNIFTENELLGYAIKDLEETECILQKIKELNMSFSNKDLINILKYTTLESLYVVKIGLDFSFLSPSFLIQNPCILFEKYKNVLELNVNYLKEHNLKLKDVDDLLLQPLLANAIETAIKYSLDVEDQNVLKHLLDPFFFDFLDILIEMQFFSYFQKNPFLFNQNFPILVKRLHIAYRLKLNLFNEKGDFDLHQLNQIKISIHKLDQYLFDSTNFYVSEEDRKLLDAVPRFQFEEIEGLKKYEEGNLVYQINGICVSKNRVLRNICILSNKEDFLSCISYHSYFNRDELLLLEKELGSRSLLLTKKLD